MPAAWRGVGESGGRSGCLSVPLPLSLRRMAPNENTQSHNALRLQVQVAGRGLSPGRAQVELSGLTLASCRPRNLYIKLTFLPLSPANVPFRLLFILCPFFLPQCSAIMIVVAIATGKHHGGMGVGASIVLHSTCLK